MIKSSITGEVAGMITYCNNYTGQYERKPKQDNNAKDNV